MEEEREAVGDLQWILGAEQSGSLQEIPYLSLGYASSILTPFF